MRPGAVLVFCFLVSHLGAAEKTAVPRQATDSAEFAAYRTASEAIAVPDFTTRLPGFVRGWDARRRPLFCKPVFRLAVILIDFPELPQNDAISPTDWQRALFSRGAYDDHDATGQPVYGSLNDYYHEISCGALRVEGTVLAPVTVRQSREAYAADTDRHALPVEAVRLIFARDGADALARADGLLLLCAGELFRGGRGGNLWPHRDEIRVGDRRWQYVLAPEGGRRMTSISVLVHEFGHLLGLPDLYSSTETPGAEGLGYWCAMSLGYGTDGKPLHFSAWCKEQLGWLQPTVVDPRVAQNLILAPVEGSRTECFKVLVRADGSEYLLLENRRSRGFDRDLPGEGLLIWRVVDGRPTLEESHGIAGPEGPLRRLGSVPYPSRVNDSFTPDTLPSGRPVKPGGLPVSIRHIRKLSDGRIAFQLGDVPS